MHRQYQWAGSSMRSYLERMSVDTVMSVLEVGLTPWDVLNGLSN